MNYRGEGGRGGLAVACVGLSLARLVARLVEGAVGEGEDVRSEDFEEKEVAGLVHLLLLDELYRGRERERKRRERKREREGLERIREVFLVCVCLSL